MHAIDLRRILAAIGLVILAPLVRADLISMNVDPAGTTSNQTLFGTVLVDGSATWPNTAGQYRDYQFELLTASGTSTFDGFAVKLSAQLRQNTAAENLLRATLWAGPIAANPLLSNSLVTLSVPNSSLTASGFTSVVLTGSNFTPQAITSTPSIFFFRVWAEGAGQNSGYQTKMAATLGEFQAVTMAPATAIDAYIDYDTNGDGTVDSAEQSATRDIIVEVPEPSSLTLAAVGAGLAVMATRRKRRRWTAVKRSRGGEIRTLDLLVPNQAR